MRLLIACLVTLSLASPADAKGLHPFHGKYQFWHKVQKTKSVKRTVKATPCAMTTKLEKSKTVKRSTAAATNCPGGKCPLKAAPKTSSVTSEPVGDVAQAFLAGLNSERARHRLRPLRYDVALATEASVNNPPQARAQRSGHFASRSAWQVAFWGPRTVQHALAGWLASPGHRAALLEPSVSTVGLAFDGDRSWTANLR